jgi:hypothetical protein
MTETKTESVKYRKLGGMVRVDVYRIPKLPSGAQISQTLHHVQLLFKGGVKGVGAQSDVTVDGYTSLDLSFHTLDADQRKALRKALEALPFDKPSASGSGAAYAALGLQAVTGLTQAGVLVRVPGKAGEGIPPLPVTIEIDPKVTLIDYPASVKAEDYDGEDEDEDEDDGGNEDDNGENV